MPKLHLLPPVRVPGLPLGIGAGPGVDPFGIPGAATFAHMGTPMADAQLTLAVFENSGAAREWLEHIQQPYCLSGIHCKNRSKASVCYMQSTAGLARGGLCGGLGWHLGWLPLRGGFRY